ncbi:heme oxygenase-like protein [Didymella exigua CBS 183.55]|uniref:Heme oxygenase-like protein n=1 Tax=Didymella exigua CBS 183.55 TaxID=1150837 RepID=A0A6A5S2S1_9PLEO|nr:heme oxygenase-like protein [Didymella exigua CBS 183.55]KAF1933724.1 heme oxygenase-like protein [Didymella exigua CBS 183.55]
MVEHHPGAFISKANIVPTDMPWALTTHLLSISIPQLRRTTTAPFLACAAQGQLPKPLIAEWIANDRLYIQGYISLAENLVRIVEQTIKATRATATTVDVESIESRLLRWLDAAIKNVKREFEWFDEMTAAYNLSVPTLSPSQKSLGVQRFEALFSQLSSQRPNDFLPWLEGAVCLFSSEKVYYEAWSWAQKQNRRRSADGGRSRSRSPNPATMDYSNDLDGGAMRKEFIPNWSNKNFMMFVETLERIINEGVGEAVGREDQRWQEIKTRADAVWQATLDAEEAFWPDVDGSTNLGATGRRSLEVPGASNVVSGSNGVNESYKGIEVRGMLGAKEGSLLEPNTRTYDRDESTLAGGQQTIFVPHVGNVNI